MFGKKEANTNIRTTSQVIETIIGPGVIFEGSIRGDATIRVDGKVKGNTDIKGCVIIGENGSIVGDVKTDRILIAGKMNGQINATERVEIVSGGNLLGDIVTKTIVIADGGVFEGNCRMSGNHPDPDMPKLAESSGAAAEYVIEPAHMAEPVAEPVPDDGDEIFFD